MEKIILRFGMTVACLLSFLQASAYDFEVDGICYDVVNPATFTCGVSGIIDKESCENIIIPAHVSYLGKELTVTDILEGAFEETSIVNVNLPNTCVSIGRSAFEGCSKLSSIVIPEGVTKIGYRAFWGCQSLESITIPPSLTEIGAYAFSYCEKLAYVRISDLKAWCAISFEKDSYGDNYKSNPLSNMKAQLLLNGVLISKLSFDDSITEINPGAFFGYAHLTEVDLTNNIQSIGRCSFYNCANLNKLRIGQGLTIIPFKAFTECPNLTELYIVDGDQELMFEGGESSYGDFRNSKLKEVYIGRQLVQPKSTTISYDAIFGPQEIDSVTIGPKVKSITRSYFGGSILKLTILPSKEALNCVFSSQTKSPLRLINPNALILGRNLDANIKLSRPQTFFDNCTDLSYLEIGEDVTDISYLNLNKNENIQNILVKSPTPPICTEQEFTKYTYLHSYLKVPSGCLNVYKSAPIWENFWNIEECDFTSSVIETIVDNANSVSVKTEDDRIYVFNKNKNDIVRVFSTRGTMITETLQDIVSSIPKGLYIVTVGNKPFKVSVR